MDSSLKPGLIGAALGAAVRLLGSGCLVRTGSGDMPDFLASLALNCLIGFLIGSAIGRSKSKR